MILLILCIIFVSFVLYKRYVPVSGVSLIHWTNLDWDKINVVDVREYNESDKNPINGGINIPVGYLKRYLKEVPKKNLHLIVSNHLEKNVSIRFLRKKGFQIAGYTIINDNHSKLKNNKINIQSTC